MPIEPINLTGHFLIAMPAMGDPNFSKTVTYICEHNEKGALGLLGIDLSRLSEQAGHA